MYTKIAMSPTPPNDTRIWRYTDLTKLLSLLDTKQLFFASILSMEDPYEGYVPIMPFEEYRVHSRSYVVAETDDALRAHYEHEVQETKDVRKCLFVNCWHENEVESAAMWKLYLSSAEGVAIQSTVGRLVDATADAPEKVAVCQVQYVDYDVEPPDDNVWQRGIHKRRSFAHEREIRAIHFKEDHAVKKTTREGHEYIVGWETLAGVPIAAHIEALIENIYVAPTCPPWIKNTIQSAVAKFGLNRTVLQSGLTGGPVW